MPEIEPRRLSPDEKVKFLEWFKSKGSLIILGSAVQQDGSRVDAYSIDGEPMVVVGHTMANWLHSENAKIYLSARIGQELEERGIIDQRLEFTEEQIQELIGIRKKERENS